MLSPLLLLNVLLFQHAAKPVVFQGSTLYSNAYSLIVSVNEGRDGISVTYDDAKKVRDLLVGSFQYDASNVTWLSGPAASEKSIDAWFERAAHFDPEACVFVYFSMHAVPEGKFLLYNDGQRRTLEMGKVAKLLEGLPCKHVAFIADACYSGLLFDQFKSEASELKPGEIERLADGQCHYVIASSGADRTSGFNAAGSRFTNQITFALSDAAAKRTPSLLAGIVGQVLDVSPIRESKARIARYKVSSAETGEFLLVPALKSDGAEGEASADQILTQLQLDVSQGRAVGVSDAVKRAVALDGGYTVRRRGATLLFQTGLDDDVAKLAAPLVQEQPTDEIANSLLFCSLLKLGNLEEANKVASAWQKSCPRSVQALGAMATAQDLGGDFASGAKILQQAVDLDPSMATTRIDLIKVLLAMGQTGPATAQIRELIRYCGWTTDSWADLAISLDQLGRGALLLPSIRGNSAVDGTGLDDALMEAETLVSADQYDEVLKIPLPSSGNRRQRAMLGMLQAISNYALGDLAKMHACIDGALGVLREPVSQQEADDAKAMLKGQVDGSYLEAVDSLHYLDPKYAKDPQRAPFKKLTSAVWEPISLNVLGGPGFIKPLWFGCSRKEVAAMLAQHLDFLITANFTDALLDGGLPPDFDGSLAKQLEFFGSDPHASNEQTFLDSLQLPFVLASQKEAVKNVAEILRRGKVMESDFAGKSPIYQQVASRMVRTCGVMGMMETIIKKVPSNERSGLADLLAQQAEHRPDDLATRVCLARVLRANGDKDRLSRLRTLMVAHWPWAGSGPLAP